MPSGNREFAADKALFISKALDLKDEIITAQCRNKNNDLGLKPF